MKGLFKKVTVFVMTSALLLGVFAVSSQDAQAASKNYMKKLNVPFDLKKGKTVSFNSYFAGVGKKPKSLTFKITKYKEGKAKKKGYKKLTVTCVNKVPYKPTRSEVNKMLKSSILKKSGYCGAYGGSVVVDYNTGLSLEKKNKFNVTVKTTGWKAVGSKLYEGSNGETVDFGDLRETLTITYPEDYDGLCIGYLVDNQWWKKTASDKKFGKGKTPFGKTSYYKKGKKNSHWMRVRASKKKTPTATTQPQATKMPTPTVSPSGGTPVAAVPTVSPSANPLVTTAPTPTVSPSSNLSVTTDPTPTGTPSSDISATTAPTPTGSPTEDPDEEYPDDISGYPVVVYDGTNGDEIYNIVEPFALVIEDGITSIAGEDERTFEYDYFVSVKIPDSVNYIGDYAFAECRYLTNILIPENVGRIGTQVVVGCDSLTEIKVSENNPVYDSRNDCNAIIETDTNTLIAGCSNTVIPDGVKTIDWYAFLDCRNLTSIVIPDSVAEIGGQAFFGCDNLTSITWKGTTYSSVSAFATAFGDDGIY